MMLMSSATLAQYAQAAGTELDPNEIRGTSTKAPVGVLQNRYFLKTWRPEIGLLAGTILNEAYTNTRLFGVRAGVFFNEWVGVEMQQIRTTVGDSDDRKALNKLTYRKVTSDQVVSPDVEVNDINGITDATMIAAPLYGKLNIMDYAIIYSDVYGSLGMSLVNTDQGTLNAISYGMGERFYWAEKWSSRIDFRDRTYVETRGGQSSRRHAWGVDFGVSYFFR